MKTFAEFVIMEDGKTAQLFRMCFNQTEIVSKNIANRFAKHWGMSLPTEIGQFVICRQADTHRGSMTITKVSETDYEVKHNNDATDLNQRL